MNMRSTIAMAMMAACAAGCGDKPQTASAAKKADGKAWDMAQSNHVAEGWKAGDQASWEAQMRLRAQGQNEYSRSAAAVAVAPTKTP